MRRALLIAASILVALILLVAATLVWLLATPSGARAAFDLARLVTGDGLQVGAVQGRLLGPLSLEGLVYEDAGARVTLSRAELVWTPAALRDRRLLVNRLALGEVDVVMKPQPAPTVEQSSGSPPTRLPVDVQVEALTLAALRVQSAPDEAPVTVGASALRGSWIGDRVLIERLSTELAPAGAIAASADVTLDARGATIASLVLDGPLHMEGSGRAAWQGESDLAVVWRDARWPLQGEPMVTSGEGRASVEGSAEDLRFELAAAAGDRTRLAASGHWNGAIDAQLSWTDLTWPLQGAEPPYRSARGVATVTGTADAYQFALDAGLWTNGVDGQITASGRGTSDAVDLARLDLAALGGHARAAGTIAWAPAVTANLRADIENLDPGALAPGWPGRINGKVELQGESGDRNDLSFTLALNGSRLRGYALAADVRGRYLGDRLSFETFDLRSGRSRLQGSGRVLPDLDARASFASPDLAELYPGLAGRAALELQAQGPLKEPHLVADGTGEALRYSGMHIASMVLSADLSMQRESRLHVALDDVDVGSKIAYLGLDGRGRAAQHRLELQLRSEDGDVEAAVTGGWQAREQRWRGQLASARLAPARLVPWTLAEPAELQVAAVETWLAPACWRSDDNRLCIEAAQSDARTRASLDVHALDFRYFKPFLPGGWNLQGAIRGVASVELRDGALFDARADLVTTAGEARQGRKRWLAFEPATIRLQPDGDGLAAAVHVPLDVGNVDVDARMGPAAALPQRALSGTVDLSFPDLAWVAATTPQLESASGRLEGHYRLSGTVGEPDWNGRLALSDGSFQVTATAIEVKDVNVELSGRGLETLSLVGSARSDRGDLQLRGDITAGEDVHLLIYGRDFMAANLPEARVWVSPNLRFDLQGDQARLSGSVEIPEADIRLRDSDNGVAPSGDQVIVVEGAPPPEEEGIAVVTDVELRLLDDVKLSGYGLSTDLAGTLTVHDEPARGTSGRGEIRLVGGRYKAYGQNLQIETGRLLFNGGSLAQPGVDLRAVRKPSEDVTVGVKVRGQLEAPLFEIFSEPPMPQQEQLAWLLLGRPLGGGADGSERSMIANAALSLGLGRGNALAQGARSKLGLDSISLSAEDGQSSDQAMLTVGKYLSPKLYVSYGVGLFQPGQVLRMLYDLGRGFKLSTESGVATGGDLLYTFERP